jgi:hypothetical protein
LLMHTLPRYGTTESAIRYPDNRPLRREHGTEHCTNPDDIRILFKGKTLYFPLTLV